jgi:hypothetical protein
MVPTHGLGRRAPTYLALLIKRVLLTTITFGALAFARLKERVAKKNTRVAVHKQVQSSGQ